MKTKKPTKDMIKRTLEASQRVWLADGHSDISYTVYVHNYSDSNSIHFPEFGNWKSFVKIKRELLAAIDKKFPKVAFPFRKLANEIVLYKRNPEDIDYLRELAIIRLKED